MTQTSFNNSTRNLTFSMLISLSLIKSLRFVIDCNRLYFSILTIEYSNSTNCCFDILISSINSYDELRSLSIIATRSLSSFSIHSIERARSTLDYLKRSRTSKLEIRIKSKMHDLRFWKLNDQNKFYVSSCLDSRCTIFIRLVNLRIILTLIVRTL